ncbi:pyridoxal phosphate-dependent transferase [Coprinopsis sp. MPI-PUGE-AT-0042]|nr:pyridoxal phosphate-dependent transferase [Coprinopsis sp. MPI-PUGE-AT-0042]
MSSLSSNTHPGQLASREEHNRLYIQRLPLPHLRQTFLSNLSSSSDIPGSGGSRFDINAPTHSRFESGLRTFFNAPQVLLFNSGSDANVGLFSAVQQRGDVVYGDALLSLESREFRQGSSSILVSVESLYNMDGTFAPLLEITQMIEEMFPLGNAYLVVDEAHLTGIYGSEGGRRGALLGLEDKALARLVRLEKALATTGAVVLANG